MITESLCLAFLKDHTLSTDRDGKQKIIPIRNWGGHLYMYGLNKIESAFTADAVFEYMKECTTYKHNVFEDQNLWSTLNEFAALVETKHIEVAKKMVLDSQKYEL